VSTGNPNGLFIRENRKSRGRANVRRAQSPDAACTRPVMFTRRLRPAKHVRRTLPVLRGQGHTQRALAVHKSPDDLMSASGRCVSALSSVGGQPVQAHLQLGPARSRRALRASRSSIKAER